MKPKTIILLFISLTGYSQNKDCSYYREGKFKLIETKSGMHTRVERIGNRQVETDLNSGKVINFMVKWTEECQYELHVIDGTSEMVNYFRNKTLIIRIIEAFSDGYRFEGHIKGSRDYKTHFMRLL